jgi:hypothetical protein
VRRVLAGLILALSLLVASLAWSGFVLLHTALDPGRSDRLADQMLDNTVLRGVLVEAIADSVESGVPRSVAVSRSQIEAAADVALEDPRVEAVVRDGIVRMHHNALQGVDEPVTVDPSAFGAAARDALVRSHPELATVLPQVPPTAITLPDAGLGFLGDLRDFLDRTVDLAAAASVAGILLALLLTTNRPAVLRRVGIWAIAASAFWLLLAYGVPWAAEQVIPDSGALLAAGLDVFLGAMVVPALLLAGAGAVLLGISVVWDAARRRSRSFQRHGVPLGSDGRPVGPVLLRAAPYGPGQPWSPAPPAGSPAPTGWTAGPPAGPAPQPAATPVSPPGWQDATRVGSGIHSRWSDGAGDQTRVQPIPAPGSAFAPPPPASGERADHDGRPRVDQAAASVDPWDRTRVDLPTGAPWEAPASSGASRSPSTPSSGAGFPLEQSAGPGGPQPADVRDDDRSQPRRSGPRWVEGIGYLDD